MTGIKSADMFLMRALEKILADKELKRSQHSQLKKACEVALEDFKKELKLQSNENEQPPINAEKYFLPFEYACKSKSPKIMETALDCIQKLIAHGYISNESTSMEMKQQLINRITRVICNCFEGPHIEDSVQLQIIKCLLTILTSPYIEVHDQSMLMPIKTCYNIHISSKSLINQASARAALTQIINTILQRFETSYEDCERNRTLLLASSANAKLLNASQSLNDTISLNSEVLLTDDTYERYITIIHEVNVNGDLNSENYDEVADVMIGMLNTVSSSGVGGGGGGGKDTPHSRKLSDDANHTSTPNGTIDNLKDIQPQVNTATAHHKPNGQQPQQLLNKDPELAQIQNPFERDAFLMFRAFCRLSQRPIIEQNLDLKNNIEIRSKILSLQLILTTLQNAKTSFKQNKHIINIIRKYLCVSLTKNGLSPINDVFELSLAIFISLLADYKQYLKKQVEIFFREIIIYLLETQTSSFEHKWLVIQTLTRICADAQCVVDLYVNYDCDLQSTNIFERLINILSKIAQAHNVNEFGCTLIQVKNLRVKGLECLSSILKCMVEWSKDLYVNPNMNLTQMDGEALTAPATVNENNHNGVSGDYNHQHNGGDRKSIKGYDSESSLTQSSVGTDYNVYNPNDLEQVKFKKELWERGIELFNKKPVKGIKYLQDQGLVGLSQNDVAVFLFNDERLDKTSIGDFLGENDIYNKEVMYAFVDQFEFTNLEIVSALRFFLQGFRLPGEAQKIDRLMEKFAHRYHECNKNLMQPTNDTDLKYHFESADAVYVIAFSIIMLATDLHSSSIKHKMTKDDYVKMNRGINENKDLPREYLEQIYEQVAESELKLKPDMMGTAHKTANRRLTTDERSRRLLYNMEIEQVTKAARALMESMYHVEHNYTSATYGQHIKPMFKIAWTPFLAAFSIVLQDSDEQRITELVLNGIRCALRLACIFRLELERDAYVQALSHFTLLTATSPITEMKSKNVECIKTLITIAQTDGNYLGASWHEILKCISQLELAQLLGNNVNKQQKANASASALTAFTAALTQSSSSSTSSVLSTLDLRDSGIDQKILANIQQQIGETITQSVVVAVDRIFTGSVQLDGDAINEFVRSLCNISVDELSAVPPRMYSLQKIVEISYYNMGRIRLQWTRIWNIIGEHFNKAGCNTNEEVAFFSVDSLRQLAMKFLEKGEFHNFRFQKDFLKPFEHIMKRNGSYTIKDMVVQCIVQMVKSKAHNIKSGWKNIFSVFHLAASTNDERIVVLAFENLSDIVKNVVEKYFINMLDSFQDTIKCLSEFACNALSPDISIEAIGLIRHCAVFVADKPVFFAEYSNEDLKNVPAEDRVWVKGWFPILFELSCIINRCKLDVRTRGLTVMFEIMKTYGESFKARWWKDLFNIVFRIFDNMKLPEAQIEKAEWMTTTCNHALYAIIDVFTQYYEIMSPILIDELYSQLKWCVKQDNEQLARSGTNCLENFVISNGHKFNVLTWDKTCLCIMEIFKCTIPYSLLTWKPTDSDSSVHNNNNDSFNNNDEFLNSTQHSISTQRKKQRAESVNSVNSSFSDDPLSRTKIPHTKVPMDMEHKVFQHLLIKCVVQLELIQTIDNIVFYPTTSKKEDASYVAAAQALSSPTVKSLSSASFVSDSHDEHGMFGYLNVEQLFQLIECLHDSYHFSAQFNSNSEQRNILWKAGFKGKDKPNLLKHETQSLACMVRVLFKMLDDHKRDEQHSVIEEKLIRLCHSSLEYYMTLPSESHRESWDTILLLLLTKIIKLDEVKFKLFSSKLYRQFCDILTFNLKIELRNVLREFFILTGNAFKINSNHQLN